MDQMLSKLTVLAEILISPSISRPATLANSAKATHRYIPSRGRALRQAPSTPYPYPRQMAGITLAHCTCKVMVIVSGFLGPGSSAYPKTRLKYLSRRHLHFLGSVFSALHQRAAV